MKTKLLLFYGYLIPIAASIIVSILPAWAGLINPADVASLFSNRPELVFTVLAVLGAVTVPFQTQLLSESNEHVLSVLSRSKTRKVFISASTFQAIIIVLLSLGLVGLSSINKHRNIVGILQMFSVSLITFEFIAMISNGRSYAEIRENIIEKVNRANKRN